MIRVISALVLGAAVLAVVWLAPPWCMDWLVIAAAAVGLVEFGKMFLGDRVERAFAFLAGLSAAAAMVFANDPPGATLLVLVLGLFVMALVVMKRASELAGSAERLGLALAGVIYLGVAFPFWSWIAGLPHGRGLVLLALVPACLCDTFALAAGKALGRHRLAPRVSPNKTMEGLAGALLGAFAGTFLMRWLVLPWLPVADAVLLSIVIWVTSPFGDLVESFFKRSSGVKDSGTLIPGHGGVLDRLDALIFTGPAVYAYAKYVICL